MSMQVRVAALRQKLEQLFPGKWLTNGGKSQRYVQTGIPEIDSSVAGGVARKRITEWTGPMSSGKTSILRSAVSYWCSRGLNVAYIDTEGKLYPADWAFVEQQWKRVGDSDSGTGKASRADAKSSPPNFVKNQAVENYANKYTQKEVNSEGRKSDRFGSNTPARSFSSSLHTADLSERGKFWIVRPPDVASTKSETQVIPLISKKHLQVQEAVWSADQFIRSNAFDVVILDLGSIDLNNRKSRGMNYCPPPWRIYARLQRALERSKAALVIVSDLAEMLQPPVGLDEARNTKSDNSNKNDTTVGYNKKDKCVADKSKRTATPASSTNETSGNSNWGCHARFTFNRGTRIQGHPGLNGVTLMVPVVRFKAWRDGRSQELEVSLASSVPNRLFTHSQIPDRRSSKG